MESDSFLPALSLTVSLVFVALASLASACLGSVRRERVEFLESQELFGADALKRLRAMPSGINGVVSLLFALSFAASLLSTVFLSLSWANRPIPLVILSSIGIFLLVGIITSLARRITSSREEPFALKIAPVLLAAGWTLMPAILLQMLITRLIYSTETSDVNATSSIEVAVADVAMPLTPQSETLDEHEVRMIRAVVQLDQTIAREIMVPRMDMIASDIQNGISEIAEQMVDNGHSRIPVYNGDLDHIKGVAHARDIVGKLGKEQDISQISLADIIRPAFFIPESKTLEELLNEFQHERVQMAIVVDEYGGVAGLVTIEDLLEEIVGEIQDEFDTGEIEINMVGENEYIVDARVGIDDLNELLNTTVESNGFDTIGGFVYHHLGKIPSQGDSVSYDDLSIEVISTVGRRLKTLRVRKPASTS